MFSSSFALKCELPEHNCSFHSEVLWTWRHGMRAKVKKEPGDGDKKVMWKMSHEVLVI